MLDVNALTLAEDNTNMKVINVMMSVGAAIAAVKAIKAAGIEFEDVLDTLGLARHQNRWVENIALLGIGAAVGAGAALLLTPITGREARQYFEANASKLGQVARDVIRETRYESD